MFNNDVGYVLNKYNKTITVLYIFNRNTPNRRRDEANSREINFYIKKTIQLINEKHWKLIKVLVNTDITKNVS